MNEESDWRLSPDVVSILTNPPSINVSAQGNLLRSHSERFETLPEDVQVIQAGETDGFVRKISLVQRFVTIHDLDDGFGNAGACREYTLLRSDENSTPKGWIRGNTKIGPVLEVKVTHHSYQCGIEIRVGSLKNDGSQSWIVICRGMNKYVDEFH